LIGITRDSVIQLAHDIGKSTPRITRDDIYRRRSAFTGTAAEVTPIRELDNRVIGAGKRGPVTEKLH
jgi:branched-chain amino acid aminotransferase